MSLFQIFCITILFPIIIYGNMEIKLTSVRGIPLEHPVMNHTSATQRTGKAFCTVTVNSTVRNGIIGKWYRWKYFDVYIDPVFTTRHRRLIKASMNRLKDFLPCVTFKLWPKWFKPLSGDYVHIVNGTGCSSRVGKVGGEQNLTLQIPSCLAKSVVLHELLHALGLSHEHQRADRDDYVTIHEENIQEEYKFAYEKLNPKDWTSYGVVYNERSIMHYDSIGFSIDGKQPTITSKRNITVGESEDVQETDVLKLQRMYNCSQ